MNISFINPTIYYMAVGLNENAGGRGYPNESII